MDRSIAPAELASVPPLPAPGRVCRIGRVRVPITLTHRPWATLYRGPDGREWWCVRLWEGQGVRRRVVSTRTLRQYASASGLTRLLADIEELRARRTRENVPA